MKLLCLLLCTVLLNGTYGYKTAATSGVGSSPTTGSNYQIPYQWKAMEFGFPNDAAKQQSEAQGNLVATNSMPIDVQPHYHNKSRLRVFVTTPKFRTGIPYSLSTISEENGPNGPLLQPYPNLESQNNNNGKNCDAITSAFRVTITECNQMWVLDSGLVAGEYQCAPQLVLFDLNTDQLIHRFRFDASLFVPTASLFVTPIVDVRDPPPRGSCRRTMVYVADVNYHGLVVYDFMQTRAWRIENMHMYPDPRYGNHTIAGDNFILMDGIIGLATDKKNLYFHPMASIEEFAVPLNVIDDRTLFDNNVEGNQHLFKPLGKRASNCVVSAMDSNNNMYCATFNPIELISWNTNTPYDVKNIKKIPIDPKEIEFVSGIKVVRNHQGNEELWMISNRYQRMAARTRDFNELNFRIIVVPLVMPGGLDDDLRNKLVFKS